jgi:hypothetical protein
MSNSENKFSCEEKTISGLIERLKDYNDWRRGGLGEMPSPKQIGKDIDSAIALLKQLKMVTHQ